MYRRKCTREQLTCQGRLSKGRNMLLTYNKRKKNYTRQWVGESNYPWTILMWTFWSHGQVIPNKEDIYPRKPKIKFLIWQKITFGSQKNYFTKNPNTYSNSAQARLLHKCIRLEYLHFKAYYNIIFCCFF